MGMVLSACGAVENADVGDHAVMTDPLAQLADEAFSACRADFIAEKGRPLSDDEEGVARRTADLCVEWAATQPVEALVPFVDGSRKKRRKLNQREERARLRSCKRYVKAHWNDYEGYGFILALISAVVWHLIVVLIVRAILKKFFTSPSLAASICKGV